MSVPSSTQRNSLLLIVAAAFVAVASTPATGAVQAVTSHDFVNGFNAVIQAAPAGELLDGLVGVQVETVPAGNPNQVVEEWNDNGAMSRVQGDLNPGSADFNESGLVDGIDLLAWQRGFGVPIDTATKADGDASGNGEVDTVDLGYWEQQFGTDGDIYGNGTPTVTVAFDLGGAFDISEINTYTNWGDARTFQVFTVNFSTDGGSNFSLFGYFESDPGEVLTEINGPLSATKFVITDDGAGLLGSGVTNIRFDIYAASIVTATGNPFFPFANATAADPFDGVNPFNSIDDGLPSSTEGAAWQEIDVFGVPTPAIAAAVAGVPEPSTLVSLLIGSLLCLGRVNRTRH